MKFSCKNMPLDHHGDVGCPHCNLAMHINDYLLSMDAQEYVAEMRVSHPNLTKRFEDGDCAMIGLVGGLGLVVADLIYAGGNPLLTGILEANFDRALEAGSISARKRGAQ